LLRRDEYTEIKCTFGSNGLPSNIDDMQLERIWYELLKVMVSSLEIDGRII
jgi:hypothetical protein